jgi:hypothetical protein
MVEPIADGGPRLACAATQHDAAGHLGVLPREHRYTLVDSCIWVLQGSASESCGTDVGDTLVDT